MSGERPVMMMVMMMMYQSSSSPLATPREDWALELPTFVITL